MTEKEISYLLALLQTQFTIKGKRTEWTKAVGLVFRGALAPLPWSVAEPLVNRVLLHSPYLPAPSDIWLRAIEIASPTLSDYEAWGLVEAAMGRPRPPKLPALVERAACDVGGLDALWHRYQYAHESIGRLQTDFFKAYQARVQAHRDAVSEEMLRRRESRNPALFPPDSPFVGPHIPQIEAPQEPEPADA